ncbi:protein translocase component YidC [Candidatus Parcubacteria bacterium]|nr:MAG: protein translocase component YidC [Candidatus Parcubacteria bacterium]
MAYFYNLVFYQPLLNTLVFLYESIAFQDFGIAVILITVLIRVVLYPLFARSVRHQAVMQRLQPKLKKVQEDLKHDREKQVAAMMNLYREHRINPFSGFGLLIAQLPVLIALYHIFLNATKPDFLDGLYSFVPHPESISASFLGLVDLGVSNVFIVGFAAIAQYFQGLTALPRLEPGREPSQAEKVGRRMVLIGPVITFLIFYNLPAAVGLYWTVTSAVTILQQRIINRGLDNEQRTVGTTRSGTG